MKKTLFFICSFAFINALAQINAVTENGDPVLLYEDGTWEYTKKSDFDSTSIETYVNPEKFKKTDAASFLVKSNVFNIGVWINPKEWTFSKETDNEDAEYEFNIKNKDIYGMMISENIEIPIETLSGIAYDNAAAVAEEIEIIKKEKRNINGKDVLMLQMNAKIQGIKIVYCGYYFSNENGTVQLLTYTGQKIFENNQEKIFEFLNGFVEIEN